MSPVDEKPAESVVRSPPRGWNMPKPVVQSEEPACTSLADIMSEQLVHQLAKRDEVEESEPATMVATAHQDIPSASASNANTEDMQLPGSAECDDDYMMALLLQREFDREFDYELALRQRKMNANDKVQVSYEKYRVTHPAEESDSESDDEDTREAETSLRYNRPPPKFASNGLSRDEDGVIITKHDPTTTYRKNAGKTQNFPPEFLAGDAVGMDVKLPNRVFNSLKSHSRGEQKRRARQRDKTDQATSEMALDANTRLRLFKMIDSGLLESLGGQVATGKESMVLHAYGGTDPDEESDKKIPRECAVKIFKTTMAEFKNRIDYVKDDYRFRNPRKLLKLWAEKERLNLQRMKRANIRCPAVVKLKDHVLVMEFIGEDGVAAPQLRQANLEDEEVLSDAYNQCVQMMTSMYRDCSLVHADLSEYNILYHRNHCYLIDVSQSVDLSHPRSLIFLVADCQHLLAFFRKRGLDDLPNERELFNEITKLDFPSDESFIAELDDFVKANRSRSIRDDKSHPADLELKRQIREENYEEIFD